MKTLFNEDNIYNEDGCEFAKRVGELLSPIIKEYHNKDFISRDIFMIILDSLEFHCCTESTLRYFNNKIKNEQRTTNISND